MSATENEKSATDLKKEEMLKLLSEEEILKLAEKIKQNQLNRDNEAAKDEKQKESVFHEPVTHEKLMPFLNAKAEFHESRLKSLKEKRDTRAAKLERNEAKLERFTDRAERLEDKNKLLLEKHPNNPLVQSVVKRNEEIIRGIREKKIPNRQEKVKIHKARIAEIDKKSAVIGHKLERVVALSDCQKSFAIFGKERRAVYKEAMNRLHRATYDCVNDKRNALLERKQSLLDDSYNSTSKDVNLNSPAEREQLRSEIAKIQPKLEKIDKKLKKLVVPVAYDVKTDEQIDKLMDNTQKVIAESLESGNTSVPELAESICESNADLARQLSNEVVMSKEGYKTINPGYYASLSDKYTKRMRQEDVMPIVDALKENGILFTAVLNGEKSGITVDEKDKEFLISKSSELDKAEATKNIEMELEDDYNNIDGIIGNNGKRNEQTQDKDIDESILVKPEQQEQTTKAKTEKASEKSFEDLYKELLSFASASAAVKIMEDEKNGMGILDLLEKYTAEIMPWENDVVQTKIAAAKSINYVSPEREAVQETQKELANKELPKSPKAKTINPEYYSTLTKDNRSIHTTGKAFSEKIMNKLDEQGVMYSAVERKNGVVAVTVARADEETFLQVQKDLQKVYAQYINPEFFKSVAKEERFTRRMSQEQAEQKVAELEKKKIPHSAVLNGEKSAVTVEKKNSGIAFVSRKIIKETAQKMKKQEKKQENDESKKDKGVDLS